MGLGAPPPGPVTPPVDLRTMLRTNLAARACQRLEVAADRRREAVGDPRAFLTWAGEIRSSAARMLALGNLRGLPLRAVPVSRHDRQHHVVENVIFASLEGW